MYLYIFSFTCFFKQFKKIFIIFPLIKDLHSHISSIDTDGKHLLLSLLLVYVAFCILCFGGNTIAKVKENVACPLYFLTI